MQRRIDGCGRLPARRAGILVLSAMALGMILPHAGAEDWGITAPPTVYSVRNAAVRIPNVRITGDPGAGGQSTGPIQLQIQLVCGSGTIHLDCSAADGVPAGQREWSAQGNMTAAATPEQFARTFDRGLIYLAADPAPQGDVLTISAASSHGGTAVAFVMLDRRESHLEAWQATHFAPEDLADPAKEPTLWGPEAKPDGDGTSNLIKFSVNRGPFESVAHLLPQPALDAAGHLVFEVIHRTDVPGLSWVPEWSTDLSHWQAGPAYFEIADPEPVPMVSDLDKHVVRAVADPQTESPGFSHVKVEQGPPPVVPDPPAPPPLTPALLAQIQAQLSALQLVPGNPSQATPAQLAAARALMRQTNGTVYGQLTQTMSLPPGCTSISSISTVSNDALVLQAIAGNFVAGGLDTASFSDIEGTSRIVTYEWVVENGQNKLVFRSPYNDRFIFHVSYRDPQGIAHNADLVCPGSVDENGTAVAEDDCTRPYHGHPRILISGFSMARFTSGGTNEDDFRRLFTDAISGMGGIPSVSVAGTASMQEHGGPSFYYAMISAQKMDICREELMARLQIIASQMGATIVRDGNVIRILGPDAGSRQPNHFLGPWADE